MRKTILVAVILIIWPTSAFSWLTSIQIDPPEPIVGEMVTITVSGYMPDSCWSFLGQNCLEAVDQTLVLEVNTYDCEGRGCGPCLTVVIPFEAVCTYEFAEPGTYEVQAVEHWDSLYPHFVLDLTRSFTVTDSVPVTATSWSALKALYR